MTQSEPIVTRSGRVWIPAAWKEVGTANYIEVELVAYERETRLRWHRATRVLTSLGVDVALEVARARLVELLRADADGSELMNYLSDTPDLSEKWCPRCEPDRDQRVGIVEVRYCEQHTPGRDGCDDASVVAESDLGGGAEAGGKDNQRWCDLVHRSERREP